VEIVEKKACGEKVGYTCTEKASLSVHIPGTPRRNYVKNELLENMARNAPYD